MSWTDKITERKYRFTFVEPCLGMSPKDAEIYTNFIATKAPEGTDTEEEISTATEFQEKGVTGFHSDVDGIYLLDYQLKGAIKHASNYLKNLVGPNEAKKKGITALRSKIVNTLFVYPRYIFLKEKPDGYIERPLRAQTAQGERIALAKSEYVSEGTQFDVTLKLLPHPELTWEVVEDILKYLEFVGISQWRGAGYGRTTFERLS